MNDAEENLNPSIFDVPDSARHFLQITTCTKHTLRPTKRNVLNVNTI